MPNAPFSAAEREEGGGLGTPTSPLKFHRRKKMYVTIRNLVETLGE